LAWRVGWPSSNGAGCAPSDDLWRDLYFFWLKIFAVSFGMGVVSGIVMSFQFGTNWAVLSEKAGNILGPLLSYEVLTAFFLEASFLGRDAVRLEEACPTGCISSRR
jgi:cytochrome bd-type quinol oxidase subunit 1